MKANKGQARKDYQQAVCDRFNQGDEPPNISDYIEGHCYGQYYVMSITKKQLQAKDEIISRMNKIVEWTSKFHNQDCEVMKGNMYCSCIKKVEEMEKKNDRT